MWRIMDQGKVPHLDNVAAGRALVETPQTTWRVWRYRQVIPAWRVAPALTAAGWPMIGMITVPFSLALYLVDATALGKVYIQVIMPMHVAR
jgi:hypothetical protein